MTELYGLNLDSAERAARLQNKFNDIPDPCDIQELMNVPWVKITNSGRPAFPSREVEEGEWERVVRMREEGHPLMKGGNYREPPTHADPSLGGMSGKGTIKRNKSHIGKEVSN